MKTLPTFGICVLALAGARGAAEDLIDRIDEALTFSAFQDAVRARFSGLMDAEGYYFQRPAPGLINTEGDKLFNPRLSLFLDAQAGSHVYAFAQARLDRGFDPGDGNAQLRLDEYAVRFVPSRESGFNIQLGRFGTVVGNWMERHHSWESPFITAPLPYENVTAVYDSEVPSGPGEFLHGITEAKYEYLPLIWRPSYATGASASGQLGKFTVALEVKNASLASRPESWDATRTGFDHPTVGGRVGYRPNPMWNLGVSASSGAYLNPDAAADLPAGRGVGDYRQTVIGQDFCFAWRHVQLWAEVYESRFEVPAVGNADSMAYYFEAKYKFHPQWFGALRWNQHLFDSVADGQGGQAPWGHDLWRIDAALGYRLTAHTQIKLQYSLQHESHGPRALGSLVAAQFTLRF